MALGARLAGQQVEMVRFWLAFAAMLWSVAAGFVLASRPDTGQHAAPYLQTRLEAARGMPAGFAIAPLLCCASLLACRRTVHLLAAFAILGFSFLGEVIYLPAAAILA